MTTDMVKQILGYYNLATKREVTDGRRWYPRAYSTCKQLSELYDVPIETVVGIMAALSPRNKWERNVADTEAVLVHGEHATVATFNHNKEKAVRILNGEQPLDVLSGNKVRSFYNCICLEDDVCVDSHAYAVATGHGERIKRRAISDKSYSEISNAYIDAAKSIGLSGSQLQAITWLAYKRIHKIW
jgi:hypothetical protein